jgi:hypothetical protein
MNEERGASFVLHSLGLGPYPLDFPTMRAQNYGGSRPARNEA